MSAVREPSNSLFVSGGFFEELQRRRVYRVAAAYIIAAGFIIQMGSAILPAWELPNWTFRLVVVLLLIGFPIALMLAWAFDVTPEGIQATPKTAAETHLRRNMIILVATGVIVSTAAGFFLLPRTSARNIDKSIAVLPFENLSGDPDNAYFADGIQDDILTNLSKIGDLKVISRTSVMSYRGSGTHNARDIGKALGVSTLLEGSVRRMGNRVRVNVQLINANNDEHIWAEDYDRDLTDVFAIQTDLAQKIASALQAKLSPAEKARLDKRPTQNPDAYLLFVQAHDYANRTDMFRDTTLKAAELDPKNSSVLLNLGYNYMATRNFEAADKIFDRGIEAAPESFGSRALKSELAIRWKGDLSVAEKELASVPPGVDPQGLVTLGRAGVLTLQRKFPEALQVIQQFRGETLLVSASVTCPKASLEGTLYLYLDDQVDAHSAFERARIIAERLVRESPDDAARHGQLGLILAGLGTKDAAIAEGKRAVELLPESRDAFDGPEVTAVLAQIYAWTGEHDQAFGLLEHLLIVPNGITIPGLKLDPVWDPLRKDPRFQALIDKYSAKS